MKTKILIFLLFLLFIAGCSGSYQSSIIDIYRGTDGLVIEFLEDSPPEEVFEKAILPMGIRIMNEGAHDITDGYVTFSVEEDYMILDKTSARRSGKGRKSFEERFDWSSEDIYWDFDKPQIRFNLKGKSVQGAEEQLMTLRAETRALEELSQIHESAILATGCYGYKTSLVATVCVDTDVYDFRGIVKPCKVKDLSFSSQGAPVAITDVDVEMMPMDIPNKIRPQFLIYIQNKGDGLVIKKDSTVISDACSEKPVDYEEFGIVTVNAYLGGNKKQLNCDVTDKEDGENKKTGVVKLRDDVAIIRCILEEGIDEKKGTYAAPLSVELGYGYTSTISKNIIIKKLSKY